MLSKEEYLNLVDALANEDKFDEYVWNFVYPGDNLSPYDVEKARDYIVENLKKLIEVHFDNPPLKFEELKLEIPYWDNKEKCWCWFETLNEDIKTGVVIHIKNVPLISAFIFEENRFFLREVKE